MTNNWREVHRADVGMEKEVSSAIALLERDGTFNLPDLRSSKRLIVASDYSGEHADVPYATFAFVIAAEDALRAWERGRRKVRRAILRDGREMAFKKLSGDAVRTKALMPFLLAANRIPGLLLVLAVAPDAEIMFDDRMVQEAQVALPQWKRGPLLKMLLIAHWLALFLGGLGNADQSIAWLTDDDSITATETHLHTTARVFWNLVQAYLGHDIPSIQVGTTGQNGDPGMFVKDIAAIADLAAGAMAASLVAGGVRSRDAVPSRVQDIVGWFGAHGDYPLRRIAFKVDLASPGRLQVVPLGFK